MKKNLFNAEDKKSFKLSRSKIDLFLECPHCFYLDRKYQIARPPSFPFNLNIAVDHLLKKEFNLYRAKQIPHPIMVENGIEAVPLKHEKLSIWQNNFKGIAVHHIPSQFVVTGAVDDLWVNKNDEIIVVDYKATSKEGSVSIDAPWQICYKRQMEVYQWLLKQLHYQVAKIGFFVYCNGLKKKEIFNRKLEFSIDLIPYEGKDDWIDPTLMEIRRVLLNKTPPPSSRACSYCLYRKAASKIQIVNS